MGLIWLFEILGYVVGFLAGGYSFQSYMAVNLGVARCTLAYGAAFCCLMLFLFEFVLYRVMLLFSFI